MKRYTKIRKALVVLVAGTMLFSMTACSKKEKTDTDTVETVETEEEEKDVKEPAKEQGFVASDSPVVSNDIIKMVRSATDDDSEATYTALADIGSEEVDGLTNHLVLCKVSFSSGADASYALVTVSKAEKKPSKLVGVQYTSAVDYTESASESAGGGWSQPSTSEMTDNAAIALSNAPEANEDTTYQPIALVALQSIDGFNYCIFCQVTDADSNSSYQLVYVSEDESGNASITDTYGFE